MCRISEFAGLEEVLGKRIAHALMASFAGETLSIPYRTGKRSDVYRRIAGELGEVDAVKVIQYAGGANLYIPNRKALAIAARNDRVIARCDELLSGGLSMRKVVIDLATDFDLSCRQIWRILNHK